jgi:hypothetical protein
MMSPEEQQMQQEQMQQAPQEEAQPNGLMNQPEEDVSGGGSLPGDFNEKQMDQFKKGFQFGQKVIYKKDIFQNLMKDMQGSDATGKLAKIIVKILGIVQEKAGKLDLIVATALGIALIGDIIDALNETGRMAEMGPEQVEDAFAKATQHWLTLHGKEYSREEMMTAKDQIKEGAAKVSQESAVQQPGPQEPQPGGLMNG